MSFNVKKRAKLRSHFAYLKNTAHTHIASFNENEFPSARRNLRPQNETSKLRSHILQSFKTWNLRNFQTNKVSQLQKRQSLPVRNYFQFSVQQHFSNSNLRHILDYDESFSVIIKSNIASIYPFFRALCPSKFLF